MTEKKKNPIGCCWMILFLIALVVTVTLFTMRITGQIDASWWLVFAPVIIVFGIPAVIISILMIVVAIGKGAESDE